MATPCLSRLLLIFLLGAINVVAHPTSKDKPAEAGNVVVQESPSLEWKPKEENHKHNHAHHAHHGSQESAVTFQKITVKLDDKDSSKHKSDMDEDEESTKAEYPSKASSKHDKTTGISHNYKDSEKGDKASKLIDEELEEMGELASGYQLLNRKEKKRLKALFKKYEHMIKEERKLKKSKLYSAKQPKYNTFVEARKQKAHKDQLDKLEEYKGHKPKDVKPWWALTTDKHNEAIHHRNELAPTGEKGLEPKRKIRKRCVPWWVPLIIHMVEKKKSKKKAKKAQEEIERLKKLNKGNHPSRRSPTLNRFLKKPYTQKEKEEKLPYVPIRDKPKPWSEDRTGKAFDKKPIEEKETQENKGSELNGNRPDYSALQQKKCKEDKQKSEVQTNKASEDSKDGHSYQRRGLLPRHSHAKHFLEAIRMRRKIWQIRYRKAFSERLSYAMGYPPPKWQKGKSLGCKALAKSKYPNDKDD